MIAAPALLGQTFSATFQNITSSLTNIADAAGSTANGLSWGFLIAETGSSIGAPLATDLGISTVDGSELADGLIFFEGGITGNAIGFDAGPGAILDSGTIDYSAFSDIDAGNPFALIWFDRAFAAGDTLQVGDAYGLLENPAFVVPPDGTSLQDFSGLFAGADEIRPAALLVQPIPEPSSALLVGIASLGLLRRRRS